jgi:putative endonuclease
MFYTYILFSEKSHKFYFGSANDLQKRLKLHNSGRVFSTKPYMPWKLVWYSGFSTESEARNFEQYLKTGSGKSFAYKRLIPVVLAKDFLSGRKGSPKSKKV